MFPVARQIAKLRSYSLRKAPADPDTFYPSIPAAEFRIEFRRITIKLVRRCLYDFVFRRTNIPDVIKSKTMVGHTAANQNFIFGLNVNLGIECTPVN